MSSVVPFLAMMIVILVLAVAFPELSLVLLDR